MKLFLKPGSCSLASHIVLEEIGRPYDTETVDLAKKLTASGADFWAINPKGYVPALLLDDGDLLTEGPAILQYLADLAPELQLAPANGSKARYQLQSWLTFIGTEVHKNFSPFFNPAATPEMKDLARANLQRRLGYVNDQLAGRDFLMGDTFSVADAYLFTVVGWAKFVQLDLSAWPHLIAFQGRVAARPATQRALKAEGLI
ncbi:MAG: glutathione transferase GstA [Aquabacterium sp.]|jgi:glutathione S-transferase|uniref:glutathione transferase GstA n=1 Tax=Aquabacterium sp. TaxID=1872578 RepID=UPI001B69EE72|nr:glutathione transferase GstA [Aquabacterium sp.]MBP6614903.1 glutathione transferase GstA [Aquabacterium sp.]MBP7503513.1 glutathione transferase GstA [Aquabacterium sp.]MCC6219089.1 glutathione transferase GstA [Aquabacterium sp.]